MSPCLEDSSLSPFFTTLHMMHWKKNRVLNALLFYRGCKLWNQGCKQTHEEKQEPMKQWGVILGLQGWSLLNSVTMKWG